MRQALLVCVAGVILFTGCHRKRTVRVPPPPPPPPTTEPSTAPSTTEPSTQPSTLPTTPEVPAVALEEGVASWYGNPFHGRASASGEIYDMEKMTAAHRTLPFGTIVRVHDLDNEKFVDVRINDRGPFVDGRIIDLSHAAARAIEMIGPGTARVRLELLNLPPLIVPAQFGVQVGAFRNRENAQHLRLAMESKYGRARVVQRADTGLWHVVVGLESTQDGAVALSRRICLENTSIHSALVVRVDSV